MDTVYPQPIKLLRLGSTARRRRGDQDRYRTQPVTFSEIKEVDEENAEEEEPDVNRRMSAESGCVMSSKSSSDVNAKFEQLFARRRVNRRPTARSDLQKKSAISGGLATPENGKEPRRTDAQSTPTTKDASETNVDFQKLISFQT